jgi:hypothetical protein
MSNTIDKKDYIFLFFDNFYHNIAKIANNAQKNIKIYKK